MVMWYLTYAVATANLGAFQFGYYVSQLNAIRSSLECSSSSSTTTTTTTGTNDDDTSFLPPCLAITWTQFSTITALMALGGTLGSLSGNTVSSRMGLKWTLALNNVLFISSGLLMGLARGVVMLGIGRVVGGVGAGVATSVAPVYTAHVVPPERMGFFGSFLQLFLVSGLVGAALVGFGLPEEWRVVLGVVPGVVGVVGLVASVGLVESPVVLVRKGELEEALRALERVGGKMGQGRARERWKEMVEGGQAGGKNGAGEEELALEARDDTGEASVVSFSRSSTHKPDPATVSEHSHQHPSSPRPATPPPPPPSPHPYDSPTTTTPTSTSPLRTLYHMLRTKRHRNALLILAVSCTAIQFSGINYIFSYSSTVLRPHFGPSTNGYILLVSLTNLIFTLLSALLLDRLGRKTLFITSMLTMALSHVLFATLATRYGPVAIVTTLVLAVIAFSLAIGAVPFILISDLSSPAEPQTAPILATVGNFFNWFTQFIVLFGFQLVPPPGVFAVFAGWLVGFSLTVGVFLPETKGMGHLTSST